MIRERKDRLGGPLAAGVAIALVVAGIDLATDSAVGIGFLGLAPLVTALSGSVRQTVWMAAAVVVLAVALGVPDEIFGELLHVGLVAGELAAGALAVYIAQLHTRTRRAQLRAELQYAVAATLQQSEDLADAAPRLLGAIGEPLGFAVGGIWGVLGDRSLRCVGTWTAGGVRAQEFELLTRELELGEGRGLPGRVLESGTPVWLDDFPADPTLPRAGAAAAAGLRSAVAFPLRTSSGIAGVVELFSLHARSRDAAMLDLLGAVGGQVAEALEASRASGALRASEALKSAMLEAALDSVVTIDHEGRVVELNAAAVDAFGYSASDAVGHEMAELIVPPDLRDAHRKALRRCVKTGEGALLGGRIELRAMRRDGSEFPIELTITRIGEADPPMFTGYIRDITARKADEAERERSERAQRLLAEAGRILSTSLDTDVILRRIAALVTAPWLADWCSFHVVDAEGRMPMGAWASADPERHPQDPRGAGGVPNVIRTGESEFSAESIVAPIASRGRTLGAVSVARFGEGPPYDPDDVALLEELGRRVGAWLDTAQLYAERSYIAKTLQESLLLAELPEIPGLRTAARFRPSGAGNEVGGDFYDLFQAGAGSWSVVVGDVCGKGPDAAAVTALARYTLRAAAMTEPAPSAGLRVLNEALLRQRKDLRFATVVYASLTPDGEGMRVHVATAGHPPPLVLRADGSVEAVGIEGTLVGVVPDPDLRDDSTHLAPGDSLVFYTDGVTEARNAGGMLGEGGLRALLERCAGLDPEAIAAAVEDGAVEMQEGETRDDIAVVVLQVAGNVPTAAKTG